MKIVKYDLEEELVDKLVIFLTDIINCFIYSCIFVYISHKKESE